MRTIMSTREGLPLDAVTPSLSFILLFRCTSSLPLCHTTKGQSTRGSASNPTADTSFALKRRKTKQTSKLYIVLHIQSHLVAVPGTSGDGRRCEGRVVLGWWLAPHCFSPPCFTLEEGWACPVWGRGGGEALWRAALCHIPSLPIASLCCCVPRLLYQA